MRLGPEGPYASAFYSLKIWSWRLKYVLVLNDSWQWAVLYFVRNLGLGSIVT